MKIENNYSLKKLNTFGVNAFSKYYAEIKNVIELSEIIDTKEIIGQKLFLLGGGSNSLFVDNFDGFVIRNSINGISIEGEDSETVFIKAGAGELWNNVVRFCVQKNLGGIENLTLIPGSTGAAPIQNIGAYGQEIKDTFHSLEAIEIKSGTIKTFTKNECEFGYRHSIFKGILKNQFMITSVNLRLNKRPELNLEYKGLIEELERLGIKHPGIMEISTAVKNIRLRKLPLPEQFGNAGSFFKNPIVDKSKFELLKKRFNDIAAIPLAENALKLSAGWLIEKCGWKGKRINNVGTYPQHSLIIINYGDATGREIFDFAMQIKNSVENEFGISLEFEVNCVQN
jgi:UDP-N-acetylmuramate dehydrogenase